MIHGGNSAIQYYSVAIYEKIGIAGDETLRYQAISSVIALVAQFLCILLVDHTGRRWPLILGNLGNMVTFIIATILLAKFPPGSDGVSGGAAWGFIAMTWLYNFSFSATCGPLSWIIPAEIFDMKTRSKGVSLATMTSFAFNTMIGQTTSVALDDETGIGWRWYILFIVSPPFPFVSFMSQFFVTCLPSPLYKLENTSNKRRKIKVCNFTNAIFFWALLPETTRRPLEEMRYLFTEAPWFVPAMDSSQFAAHDLERRVQEVEKKQEGVSHIDRV